MSKARDRIRRGKRKGRSVFPSGSVRDRVTPIVGAGRRASQAAIVWEETRESLWGWVLRRCTFTASSALVVSGEANMAADRVVEGLFSEGSHVSFSEFVEGYAIALQDLSAAVLSSGGFAPYYFPVPDENLRRVWERVDIRCASVGAPV